MRSILVTDTLDIKDGICPRLGLSSLYAQARGAQYRLLPHVCGPIPGRSVLIYTPAHDPW